MTFFQKSLILHIKSKINQLQITVPYKVDGRISIFTVKLSTANWVSKRIRLNMRIFVVDGSKKAIKDRFTFFWIIIEHARIAGFEFVYPRNSLYSRQKN